MRRRYLPLTALALVLAALPNRASAGPGDDLNAYSQSGYAYCDAKLLSSLWSTSVAESKATIGRKVRGGNKPAVEASLVRARGAAAKDPAKRCVFSDTGFSYADAEKLAKLWKMPITKAKALVEQKVTAGDSEVVRSQLGGGGRASNSDAEDARAWGTSGLSYCDAKVLSKYWQVSVAESKSLVGRKIRSNNKPALSSALGSARTDAAKDESKRCEFGETDFSYSDAEKLAKLWKTSVGDAKSRVELKVSAGNAAYVRDLLKPKTKK